MSEVKELQQLHLLAAQGIKLSAAEKTRLEKWYEKLDEEESVINRNFKQTDLSALKKKVESRENQVSALSKNVTDLIKQNEKIRQENQKLRKQLELRLLEQAA